MNTMKDSKFYIGKEELTNIIRVMIRGYKFWNKGKEPEAIVFPDIKEVGTVKVEFPKVETRPRISKVGS